MSALSKKFFNHPCIIPIDHWGMLWSVYQERVNKGFDYLKGYKSLLHEESIHGANLVEAVPPSPTDLQYWNKNLFLLDRKLRKKYFHLLNVPKSLSNKMVRLAHQQRMIVMRMWFSDGINSQDPSFDGAIKDLTVFDYLRNGWKGSVDICGSEQWVVLDPIQYTQIVVKYDPGQAYYTDNHQWTYSLPNYHDNCATDGWGRDDIGRGCYPFKPVQKIRWGYRFQSDQVECRSHPAPSYWGKSWSKMFSGRGKPDWIVKQYNDHCRPKYLNPKIFSCASSWWLHGASTTTPPFTKAYVYGISMDPIRAAVATEIETTAKDGIIPRLVYPRGSYYIGNNYLRFYVTSKGAELYYDPSHSAHFDENSQAIHLFTFFLDSNWAAKSSIVVEEPCGYIARLHQKLTANSSTLEIRYQMISDIPQIEFCFYLKGKLRKEKFSITFNNRLNVKAIENGYILQSKSSKGSREFAFVGKDSQILAAPLKGGRGEIALLSAGRGESTKMLLYLKKLGGRRLTCPEVPFVRDKVSVRKREIIIPPRKANLLLLEIDKRPERSAWICEQGWWTHRGFQKSLAFPNKYFLKVYPSRTKKTHIQPKDYINDIVRPGWGCQYMVYLKDIKRLEDGGVQCLAKVISINQMTFAPRIEFRFNISQVFLNGKQWHYYDQKNLMLPNSRAIYQIIVKKRNLDGEIPHLLRTFAKVTYTTWDGTNFTFNGELPEWNTGLHKKLYLAAVIVHKGYYVDECRNCQIVRRKGGKIVVRFKPGIVSLKFAPMQPAKAVNCMDVIGELKDQISMKQTNLLRKDLKGFVIETISLKNIPKNLDRYGLIIWNQSVFSKSAGDVLDKAVDKHLNRYVENGGRLFLLGYASAHLKQILGLKGGVFHTRYWMHMDMCRDYDGVHFHKWGCNIKMDIKGLFDSIIFGERKKFIIASELDLQPLFGIFPAGDMIKRGQVLATLYTENSKGERRVEPKPVLTLWDTDKIRIMAYHLNFLYHGDKVAQKNRKNFIDNIVRFMLKGGKSGRIALLR